MIGMKDFSFPKERCAFQTYGIMSLTHLLRSKKPDPCLRYMNREKAVYVRRVFCVLQGHLLTSAALQGADADDFNPDRFIDADGQVTPAIADTKDGASVIRN